MLKLVPVQIVTDGLLLSAVLGTVILISLYVNPRIWIQDYPEAIRVRIPPLNAHEKRQRIFFGVLFMGGMIGMTLYFGLQVRAQQGGAVSFGAVFAHLFLVFNIFNLFDALILDYLFLGLLRPAFALVPEVAGMEHVLVDARLHLVNYLKGIFFAALFCLPLAAFIALS